MQYYILAQVPIKADFFSSIIFLPQISTTRIQWCAHPSFLIPARNLTSRNGAFRWKQQLQNCFWICFQRHYKTLFFLQLFWPYHVSAPCNISKPFWGQGHCKAKLRLTESLDTFEDILSPKLMVAEWYFLRRICSVWIWSASHKKAWTTCVSGFNQIPPLSLSWSLGLSSMSTFTFMISRFIFHVNFHFLDL